MGRLLLFGCSVFLLVGSGFCATWEFGEDRLGSRVIATSIGDMNLFQKVRSVQLMIPPCFEVVYVKVDVYNDLTTPYVTYDKDTHTVVIRYTWIQSSISTYSILVKGISKQRCPEHTRANTKIKKYRPIDSEEIDQDSNDYDYRALMELLNKLGSKKKLPPVGRIDPYYYNY